MKAEPLWGLGTVLWAPGGCELELWVSQVIEQGLPLHAWLLENQSSMLQLLSTLQHQQEDVEPPFLHNSHISTLGRGK